MPMVNRRRLLTLLGALPFVGALIKPDDGVALMSTTHPVTYLPSRLHEADLQGLVFDEIEFPIYAHKGEVVICAGPGRHVVGLFTEDLCLGALPWGYQFRTLGKQEQPEPGQMGPLCCHWCSGRYADEQGRFHFWTDGWRDFPKQPPRL